MMMEPGVYCSLVDYVGTQTNFTTHVLGHQLDIDFDAGVARLHLPSGLVEHKITSVENGTVQFESFKL